MKDFEESSGNVFADLGLPNADQELVKAKLVFQIHKLLKDRNIKQDEAAKLLKTTQPQVSALMRCKPASVSIERLLKYLTILGQDIEVTVRPVANKQLGKMSVIVQPST